MLDKSDIHTNPTNFLDHDSCVVVNLTFKSTCFYRIASYYTSPPFDLKSNNE